MFKIHLILNVILLHLGTNQIFTRTHHFDLVINIKINNAYVYRNCCHQQILKNKKIKCVVDCLFRCLQGYRLKPASKAVRKISV